jgi:flagellar biosynthesis protein
MTSETEHHSSAAVALKYDGEKAPTISATGTHELAEEIIRIARELGAEPAKPEEARQILGLKGLDRVGY